jgi:hypothetical protein
MLTLLDLREVFLDRGSYAVICPVQIKALPNVQLVKLIWILSAQYINECVHFEGSYKGSP